MSDLREQEMIPEQLKKLIYMARGGYGEHSETAEWALREIDRFQQKITMLESRLASLTAEREEMERKWTTLREWLEHDKAYGQGHKVNRAIVLMDELDSRPLPEKGK